MTWGHLWAFVWLRWRLRVNQMRRGGFANVVILGLLAVVAAGASVALAVTLFLLALYGLRDVPPAVLLYVWDGLVALFLFFWTIGLLSDLQRADALSLDKILHLPVSPAGAFLINYVSSLFSVLLALFVPGMVALALGLVLARGPALLVQFPLLAAFLLAVTAITYQFQGWLGALMANPRRRRTVIVLLTLGFILVFQLPNIIVNVARPWEGGEKALAARERQEADELQRAFNTGQMTPEEYGRGMETLRRGQQVRREEAERRTVQQLAYGAEIANVVLPPGWVALGTESAALGNFLPAVLGTLGLGLVGGASLWRAYRTTLRLYTGQFSSGARQPEAAPVPAAEAGRPSAGLLERELPYLSEPAAAVALGGFRSLLRAPEAKMMLLSPLILVLVFGSMLLTKSVNPPVYLRPLLAAGGMAAALLGTAQVAVNLFGFDRDGFRVFVLSAAPRREILLGKNLALAPIALGLQAVLLLLVELVYPMRVDYFLAALPQLVMMYLLFALAANWLSILAPMRIAQGSFKAANAKGLPLLLHLAFVFLFPLVLAPALVPLGVQLGLQEGLGWGRPLPIALVLALAECVGVVYLYRLGLTWQGRVLQGREQKILQTVTTKD
ncbi:MAG TPA: hypothetical protein VJ739_16185 [Gemmataceae bacterium]|nr:hypothetical protein [Gemmataceae bacterium]